MARRKLSPKAGRPPRNPRARVIKIVASLPEATACPVGTHLRLEVGGRKFAWYMDNHHGDERIQINCIGAPGKSHMLARTNPAVYHIPAYVGKKGWIGIWLDVAGVDWTEVKALLAEAYAFVAPARLLESPVR